MSTTIYKLEDIPLQSGLYVTVDDVINDRSYDKYYSDLLRFYICVTTEDELLWVNGGTPVDKVGNISNQSELREQFDVEKSKFQYEDISIDAENASGFWSDFIFIPTNKHAEIRIVVLSNYNPNEGTGDQCYTKEAVFAGVISLDQNDIEHFYTFGDAVGKYLKSYSFTCSSELSKLGELSPDALFAACKMDQDISTDIASEGYIRYYGTIGETEYLHVNKFNFENEWSFIKVSSIFKRLFSLLGYIVYYDNSNFSITCDWTFGQDWETGFLNEQTIDNIYVPFSYTSNGTTKYSKKLFSYKVEDGVNIKDDTPYTLFQYQNCLEILSMMLNTFGLVYDITYSVGTTNIWMFTIDINLHGRLDESSIVVIDNIKSIKENYNSRDLSAGCKVDVLGHGEYISSPKPDINLQTCFCIQPRLWDTGFGNYGTGGETIEVSGAYNYGECGSSWEHSLFYKSTAFYFVTNIYFNSVNYYKNLTMLQDGSHVYLGEFLAKYFTDPTYGIFGIPRKTLDIEIEQVTAYITSNLVNNLKPTKRTVLADETFFISEVEKDFLNDSAKLKLVKYE
jgi:hypothetical protein